MDFKAAGQGAGAALGNVRREATRARRLSMRLNAGPSGFPQREMRSQPTENKAVSAC
ncbi:hypothetical protein [Caulobacter vibrioides]|uniref:Uncharacterized protein n=1 Tax=Caulobacter vibrioides (strain NA1000 / CB15N) TaxID=565050 RepID=A0A0H3IWF6_CAUVN|nr:hypothetical protein [Caulobacter vibrioides]YP_009020532.1 hypothetical protein CCNA_03960 [Caulobacter vibrioides NA1000]AHI88563.1 hypothetical protein CCNA_03960 [Caulobacter vibrioides NA1000]AVH77082.1 hypothetical protein CA607_20410 [Caulobacter vibrioides]QXZ50292.1 hypothetical protein KZH45_10190 [Caulobacter vibrioides]